MVTLNCFVYHLKMFVWPESHTCGIESFLRHLIPLLGSYLMDIGAHMHRDKGTRMSISAFLVTTMMYFLSQETKCQSTIHFYPFKLFKYLSMSRNSLSLKRKSPPLPWLLNDAHQQVILAVLEHFQWWNAHYCLTIRQCFDQQSPDRNGFLLRHDPSFQGGWVYQSRL